MKVLQTTIGKLILLTLTLAGCGAPTDTDGSLSGSFADRIPDSTVNLTVQGSLPAATALVASGIDVIGVDGSVIGQLSLTDARLVLERIQLKGQDEVDDEDDSQTEADSESETVDEAVDSSGSDSSSVHFNGPYVVDLLTDQMTPSPESILIPAGVYNRVKLSIHKVEDSESLGMATDDPLSGQSIYLAGEYTDLNGTVKPLTMSFDLSEEFEVRNDAGFNISTETLNAFIIAFRIADWFDFSNAETNSDGYSLDDILSSEIHLNKDSDETAKSVREVIKENIKTTAEAGKDEDDDGELNSDEDGVVGDDEDE